MSLVNDILKELEKSDQNQRPDLMIGQNPASPTGQRRRRSKTWISVLSVCVIVLSGGFFALAFYMQQQDVVQLVKSPAQPQKTEVNQQQLISQANRNEQIYSLALPVRPTRNQMMRVLTHDLDLMFGVSLYDNEMMTNDGLGAKTGRAVPSHVLTTIPVAATAVAHSEPVNTQQPATTVSTFAQINKPEVSPTGKINKAAVAANWLDKSPEKITKPAPDTPAQIELAIHQLAKQVTSAVSAENMGRFNALMTSLLMDRQKRERIASFMQALTSQNNYLVANRAIQFLLAHDTEHDFNLIKLAARFYLKQGQTLQAVNILQRQTPTLEEHTDYYSILAYALIKMKDYQDSLALYKQLVSIDNQQASWWLGLGIDYQALKDNQQALMAYRRALKYAPERTAYRYYITDKIHALLAGSA